MLPLVCSMLAATPSLPLAPTPVGQFTDLPTPGPFFQLGLKAARELVKL